MVIKNILVSDGTDCLEDALQVATTYNHLSHTEVYIFRLRSLIQHDRVRILTLEWPEFLFSVLTPSLREYQRFYCPP